MSKCMKDTFGRNIDYLRISITQRCNLACTYCMPKEISEEKEDVLTYDEIIELVEIFAQSGIRKIKLTGGEPLVRKNVSVLVKNLLKVKGIEEVTLTTNGILLDAQVEDLYAAGIRHINVSLDTLDEEIYHRITGQYGVSKVWKGILHALSLGMHIKINVVAVKERTRKEIIELVNLAKEYPLHVRFIELMPIGMGKQQKRLEEEVVRSWIKDAYGELKEVHKSLGNGPCSYYALEGFQGYIGFISALSHEFCANCSRLRLTADGFLKPCLQYSYGCDLKEPLKKHDVEEVRHRIENMAYHKPKSHAFLSEDNKDKETKPMSKIGG